MFEITDWLKHQTAYGQQVIVLGKNVFLIQEIKSANWHKLKIAFDESDKYLLSQEALWLRRSAQSQSVKCYLSQTNADFHLLVMDYLDGESLSDYLKGNRQLDMRSIMSSLCNNLNQLHEQGIVHNDIKPSNIIVMENESHLIDLASAGWVNQNYSSKRFKSYTPAFILPEPYLPEMYMTKVDWYAYFLILDLLKSGTVLSLNESNQRVFFEHQQVLIRSYLFEHKLEVFLFKQLNSIV